MDRAGNAEPVDVCELTVEDIHARYESGALTAVDLVDRYRSRIDAYDGQLNAILTVNDGARGRAAELDERFAQEGFVGPLHGIPIILKDNQDTRDLPTTAGSVALADSRPDRDATVVDNLRSAGGIILAKANLQELSFGVNTVSSLGGETRNAYALDRRPSGSSGGTAAAIAANLGAVGTGSDTCSSVRSPPAFNNLVGIRPTRGLITRTGIVPLSTTQDTAGPITRTVGDAARMLDAMAGFDPSDPVTARGHDQPPDGGYVAHLDPDGLEGARIGVLRDFFGRQGESSGEDRAAAVTTVVERAITELANAGSTLIDPVSVPDVDQLASARVIDYEFKREFDAYLDGLEDPPVDSLRSLVESGTLVPEVADRIRSEEILDVEPATLSENGEYLHRLHRRGELRDATLARLAEHELDAVLYPPSTIPPVRLPDHQPFEELNCELAAHTGLPAIVIQAGFTDDGLPVGLELLGRAFSEPRLIELGASFEAQTSHRRAPNRFGSLGTGSTDRNG